MNHRVWTIAAITCSACLDAHAAGSRLLVSEVVVAPTPAEMIAIYNPNPYVVDLSDYYLADYESYYNLVVSVAPASSDFVVRFPAGARIGSKQTQFIAVGGAECFKSACGVVGPFAGFGVYPTFEIPSSTTANNSADVPDMLSPFGGAIGSTHGITNAGEPITLFYWDGATNLVTDVDYVFAGTPSVSQPAVNKTGVTINGSEYLPDTADTTAQHAPLTATGNIETCRVHPYTEGAQIASGGNGVGGADETSEDTANTWSACASLATVPVATVSDILFADGFEPFTPD